MNALLPAKYGANKKVIVSTSTVKNLIMRFITELDGGNYMYDPTIIQDLDDTST
jgi:hypothetical protein